MKKQLLCVMSLAFVLSGCSQAQTSIQNANEEIMTINGTTYTRNDEYNFQKKSNGPSGTVQLALKHIYSEEIGIDDSIRKEAKKQVQESIDSVENFESQVQTLGYKDIQDYTEKVAIPAVQSERLLEKYLKDNKKAVQEKLDPSMAQIIECANEENANQALAALKEGTDLETIVSSYGVEGSAYTGVSQFINANNYDLPTRLVNLLASSKKAGVIDEVFFNESNESPKYFVAVLESNDYDKNIKKYAHALKEDQAFNEECLIYYLDKYNFEIHDQDIFNYFKANKPAYLVNRPDLMENK